MYNLLPGGNFRNLSDKLLPCTSILPVVYSALHMLALAF